MSAPNTPAGPHHLYRAGRLGAEASQQPHPGGHSQPATQVPGTCRRQSRAGVVDMVSPGCGIAGLVIVVVLISMLRTQLFGEFFLLALTLIALSVIGFLWGCIRLFTSTTRTQRMLSLLGIILNVMLWLIMGGAYCIVVFGNL